MNNTLKALKCFTVHAIIKTPEGKIVKSVLLKMCDCKLRASLFIDELEELAK